MLIERVDVSVRLVHVDLLDVEAVLILEAVNVVAEKVAKLDVCAVVWVGLELVGNIVFLAEIVTDENRVVVLVAVRFFGNLDNHADRFILESTSPFIHPKLNLTQFNGGFRLCIEIITKN